MTNSEVLLKAADLIAERGWCKGVLSRKGRLCVIGAIQAAVGENYQAPRDAFEAWLVATKGVKPYNGFDVNTFPGPRWNDRPGASKIRVIGALRACARDLAAQEQAVQP